MAMDIKCKFDRAQTTFCFVLELQFHQIDAPCVKANANANHPNAISPTKIQATIPCVWM
jgi:hypothetical protein